MLPGLMKDLCMLDTPDDFEDCTIFIMISLLRSLTSISLPFWSRITIEVTLDWTSPADGSQVNGLKFVNVT